MTSLHAGTGKVWLVGAGPGDPDLITLRGKEVLQKAEVVLHDALSHPELLEFCQHAEIHNVGKRYGQSSPPQKFITERLLHFARQGKRVVRLKGGDPMLFARGAEEALALAEAGIPFEIVPGIASPIAASAYAGISLTHRDASSSVTFITGSDREGKDWSPEAWKKLATATGTICVLMGMRRLEEITQAILDGGRAPQTPAAVVMWGARPEQRTVVGSLETIAVQAREAGLTNPSVIFIGEVVNLREQLNWYETKPLFGRRILVPRPGAQARETVRAIRERGAAALVHPALVIQPPPDPAALREAVLQVENYEVLLFTSANGVHAALQALYEQGKDVRLWGRTQVGAIGPKTAAALRSYGICADFIAREYVAESLVEEVLRLSPRPQRLLLLRALQAREVLPEQLRQAGVEVDVVPAYQTLAVQGEKQAQLVAAVESEADVVLLTSSSMVDSLVSSLGERAISLLAERTIVCIGPITAQTARHLGVRVDVEASVYTVEGALDALAAHLHSEGRETEAHKTRTCF